jgi:hypothetical protein
VSNVVPLGITHDPGCNCRRCLTGACRAADATAIETARRYKSIRTSNASATSIGQARQQWAEARQVLVLAEYALRTAEDETFIEERENRRTDALRWNPEGAL